MNPTDLPLINSLDEADILALTIAGEAEAEPIEGQIGVACVIRNRHKNWNKPIKDICLEKNAFSCWLSISSAKDYDRILSYARSFPTIVTQLRQIFALIPGILNDDILDNTNGSLYYVTTDLFNRKFQDYKQFMPVHRLGTQLFYRGK